MKSCGCAHFDEIRRAKSTRTSCPGLSVMGAGCAGKDCRCKYGTRKRPASQDSDCGPSRSGEARHASGRRCRASFRRASLGRVCGLRVSRKRRGGVTPEAVPAVVRVRGVGSHGLPWGGTLLPSDRRRGSHEPEPEGREHSACLRRVGRRSGHAQRELDSRIDDRRGWQSDREHASGRRQGHSGCALGPAEPSSRRIAATCGARSVRA